jgi:hypothetical protein
MSCQHKSLGRFMRLICLVFDGVLGIGVRSWERSKVLRDTAVSGQLNVVKGLKRKIKLLVLVEVGLETISVKIYLAGGPEEAQGIPS